MTRATLLIFIARDWVTYRYDEFLVFAYCTLTANMHECEWLSEWLCERVCVSACACVCFIFTIQLSFPCPFFFYYVIFIRHFGLIGIPYHFRKFQRIFTGIFAHCINMCVCSVANKLLTIAKWAASQAWVLYVNFFCYVCSSCREETDKLSDKQRRLPYKHTHTYTYS